MSKLAEVPGAPGELVQRFLELVFSPAPETDPRWANVGLMVAINIGGVTLFTPEDMPTPDHYRMQLHARLMDLVAQGVDEEFIISALLADLDRFFDRRADAGLWNERAARDKKDMLDFAGDLPRLRTYKLELQRSDPTAARLTDDELALQLRQTAESGFLYQPMSADDAAIGWASRDHWTSDCDAHLPQEVIDRWRRLHTMRLGDQALGLG